MAVVIKNKKSSSFDAKETGKRLDNLLTTELFLSPELNDQDKENFYQYMATLAGSGILLPNILKLYSEEELSKKAQKTSAQLYDLVIKGDILSRAMEKTGAFEPYEYYNIAIAEETGKIHEVLISLKKYYENKLRQTRKIRSALVYPLVVIAIAVIAVWFLMTYVVPLFMDVYKRFGGDLPGLTKFIISASDFFSSYSWLILFIVILAFVARRLLRKTPLYKKYTAMLLLKIPTIGELVRQSYMARFCNSITLMLKANITFLRSLEMTGKMIDFQPIQSIIPKISDSILRGSSVNAAFAEHKIFDKQMLTLIKVGEEVNRLDDMFEKLSNNYEESLGHSISIINTLIEPAIIIFLGLVIGFILVAMYLPLFNMGNQMVM